MEGEDLLEGPDNILFDQTIRLTGQQTGKKYPSLLRRIVYYSMEHKRSFTYLPNSFEVKAEYCLVAIIEHDLRLNRSTFDVLRILSMSLFDKTPIRELFERTDTVENMTEYGQAQLCFNF